MARNIVFCADGTWNEPRFGPGGRATNVWRLFTDLEGQPTTVTDSTVVKESSSQVAMYIDGVGTTRFRTANILQGALGGGIGAKIREGYLFLSQHYQEGDRVYLFGFSRGAYIVRALAGIVSEVGLLELKESRFTNELNADGIVQAFQQRRTEAFVELKRKSTELPLAALRSFQTRLLRFTERRLSRPALRPCPIAVLGVWDTVGALGIPVSVFGTWSRRQLEFHNVDLSANVQHGFHALAIDDFREAFRPAIWNPRSNLEQVWFAGAHSDVGGGCASTGLSDFALRWMVTRTSKLNVEFRGELLYANDILQRPEDSYSRAFGARIARTVPKGAVVHESVFEKLRLDNTYRPQALVDLASGVVAPEAVYETATDAL